MLAMVNRTTLVRLGLIAAITALVFFAPSFLSSRIGKVRASKSQDQSVPSRIYVKPGPNPAEATRKNTTLPSDFYGVRVPLDRITVMVRPPAGESLQDLKPNQIGVERPVAIASDEAGRLIRNPDGSSIRMIALRSAGAAQIRVHLQNLDLPAGDKVYLYGTSPDSHVAGPYTGEGPFGDGDVWADSIEGDTVVIEYYIKSFEHPFQIKEIAHFVKTVSQLISTQVLSCEQDASCSQVPEDNAVARFDFINGGVAFVCTGTLINDQAQDDAPYFLTANHCISSNDEAHTVELFWFYRTTACNSGQLMDSFRSVPTGATLVFHDQPSDSSLLSVTGAIPSGAVFAGWDPNPRTDGTTVFGLHHPGGTLPPDPSGALRIANGTIMDSTGLCTASGLTNGYDVTWSSGITEPGASGSGLFATDNGVNHLVGVLSCGPSTPSCDSPTALYGKFSDFYTKIQTFLKAGPGCTFTLSNTSQAFGYYGGPGSVSVVAAPQCAWSAAVSDDWIALSSGASGTGNGVVTFIIAGNPTSQTRTGTITIGGQVLTITEGASVPAHNAELSVDGGTTDQEVGAGGGTLYALNRLTPDSYPATITAVEVSFDLYSGITPGRTLDMVVGNNSGGSPNIDGITLKHSSGIVTTGNGFSTIPVPPMTITQGDFVAGFTLNGAPFLYPLTVDQTSPSKRRSYVSLDGRRFVLLDDIGPDFAGNLLIRALVNEGVGACGATLSPTQQQFPTSGGAAMVGLTTGGTCSWTASTDADWIMVSPQSGSGNAQVSLTIQPNTAGPSRAAAVVIAGNTFLVTQAPGDTKPSISTLSASLNGDTLTLTGTAADPGGDITTATVSLLDGSGATVTTLPPISHTFGSAPSVNFTLNVTGLSAYPSAVTASLVLTDSAAFSSSAVSADFSHGDMGGPNLTNATFNSNGVLVIKGTGFSGAGPLQVEVNGMIVAPPATIKVKGGGAKLKIPGGATALNIKSGPNRVRVINNGLRSNLFVVSH